MTLTNDNPKLNEAIINYKASIKAVDLAINDEDITIEALEALEDKEAVCEECFFGVIFSMMPNEEVKSMQEPRYLHIFKSKVSDKYILNND
jgi:hypothetical protein